MVLHGHMFDQTRGLLLSAGGCRYDKSAFIGRGDRADPSTWPKVPGPLDLVFFEGWMLGFKPVTDEAAGAVEASLQEVNRQLAGYQEAWDSLVDAWLVIRIADPQVGVCLQQGVAWGVGEGVAGG